MTAVRMTPSDVNAGQRTLEMNWQRPVQSLLAAGGQGRRVRHPIHGVWRREGGPGGLRCRWVFFSCWKFLDSGARSSLRFSIAFVDVWGINLLAIVVEYHLNDSYSLLRAYGWVSHNITCAYTEAPPTTSCRNPDAERGLGALQWTPCATAMPSTRCCPISSCRCKATRSSPSETARWAVS